MLNPVKLVGQVTKEAGRATFFIGVGTLFLMAILGTIAIDIVVWAALINATSRDRHNSFTTGFLFAMIFSNSGSRSEHEKSWPILLLLSPILTVIAIGLSFLLGVPEVGMVLVAGWLVGLTLLGGGLMLSSMGDGLVGLGEFLGELLSSSCEASYNDEYDHDDHCGHNHHPMPKRSTAPFKSAEEPYQPPRTNPRFFGDATTATSSCELPPPYTPYAAH